MTILTAFWRWVVHLYCVLIGCEFGPYVNVGDGKLVRQCYRCRYFDIEKASDMVDKG